MAKKERFYFLKLIAVIPCFNVGRSVFDLIEKTLLYVDKIILVDDCCPVNTGSLVKNKFKNNKKIIVLENKQNLGVGGAVKRGYNHALKFNCEYIVKLDGDGQMNPKYILKFKKFAEYSNGDYIKGNRFFKSKEILKMPIIRLIGNIGISYLAKISTGLWHIFDFSNGYTFIKVKILKKLDLNQIKNNYFFETDILFHLNQVNAKVYDINIPAKYSKIKSNLKIWKIFHYFFFYNIKNLFKRIFQ